MDEGKIVLIGNETDLLHCGYNHAIKDAGRRYPSAIHYTHAMYLGQLGVPEYVIDELLCTASVDVPDKAHQLLLTNMPAGHDMNSLASYLQSSKTSYTMQGLRLRLDQDAEFQKVLMNTNDALLVVCDTRDTDLGIGMDDKSFAEWMSREAVNYDTLSSWMKGEYTKPAELGNNQLGIYLMFVRAELKEKNRSALMNGKLSEVKGLSMDKDDNPMIMKVNELVVSLQGIFRPLSNYYACPFEMKGERYRSVEHYAYEKLFNSLKLDDKQIEKIQTCVLPTDVSVVADRVFAKLEIDHELLQEKFQKMDRWRQSAMKHKISRNDYMQQLLLSTGNAILIDPAEGDPLWTCGATEFEIQRLLTKSYVTPSQIIEWMKDTTPRKQPRALDNIRGNKAGLLLMELREKLGTETQSRIPLVSPMNLSTISSTVSPHVICFTPSSVWHPLYPAEVCPTPDQPSFPSPAHLIAQNSVKYLGMNKEDTEYVLEATSSVDCWYRLHETIESKVRGLEREQSWWMEKRQKCIKDALELLLQQHPPLLRALLETGEAMLVYCARFSSIDAELSIGMRETDLRVWMHHVDINTKQLLELCSRPMAFRPAYLGGNRLGLILMELRKEFAMRGACPQILPDLPLAVDVILGTDSPSENFVVTDLYDITLPEHYTSIWMNPLFLLAKNTNNPDLVMASQRTKLEPRLVTIDDRKVSDIVEYLNNSDDGVVDETYLATVAPEDLRAVFSKYCSVLEEHMIALCEQENEMREIGLEVSRLTMIRRGLEETRLRELGPSAPPINPPPVPLMSIPSRIAAGRDLSSRYDYYDDLEEATKPPPVTKAKDLAYKIPTRKRPFGSDRKANNNEKTADRPRAVQSFVRVINNKKPTTPKLVEKKKTPPPATPPAPKEPKIKRPADEELSDGEILSSDED